MRSTLLCVLLTVTTVAFAQQPPNPYGTPPAPPPHRSIDYPPPQQQYPGYPPPAEAPCHRRRRRA